jgi:hypothetical protein
MDLKRKSVGEWTGFTWLMTGTGGDTCELDNEFSASIKGGEFLYYLSVLAPYQQVFRSKT